METERRVHDDGYVWIHQHAAAKGTTMFAEDSLTRVNCPICNERTRLVDYEQDMMWRETFILDVPLADGPPRITLSCGHVVPRIEMFLA